MKFFIIPVLLGTIVLLAVISFTSAKSLSKSILPSTPTPAGTNNQIITESAYATAIVYENTNYILRYAKLSGRKLTVIPNFTRKRSAAQIVEEHRCSVAVNGGFYTKEDKPLGFFMLDSTVYTNEIKDSNLVNGFFYVDDAGNPRIGDRYPAQARTVIQSGPYYATAGRIPTVNDKPARRSVLFQTEEKTLYMGAVTLKNQTTSGPYLSDIGALLFSIHTPFTITEVLNMDGGAASYFRGEDGYELSELTYVGSIICAR